MPKKNEKKKKERINTAEMEDSVKELRKDGFSLRQISQKLGISKSSVQNILNQIDKRKELGELRDKEKELRDKERRRVQKEREINEKEKTSEEKIVKRLKDAELELKKTKRKKEEYEARIGEIKIREKEANKLFDEIKGLGLVSEEVLSVAHDYKAVVNKKKSLKKNISNLQNNRAQREEFIDDLKIRLSKSLREYRSLSDNVASLRNEVYSFRNEKAMLETANSNMRRELEKENTNFESVQSEIDREKPRLDGIKNDYETIKKNYDDLLFSWNSRINEEIKKSRDEGLLKLDKEIKKYRNEELSKLDKEIKKYRNEELSKLDKELEEKKVEIASKQMELKKLDQIISSKKKESDALIGQTKELMDVYLGLRERILFNKDRCDSIERQKDFEKVLRDVNEGIVSMVRPKQPATSVDAKARGMVRKVVINALRKNGIAIPEI